MSKVLLKLYIDVIHESEGRGVDEEGRTEAAEVVEVLERMHAEAGEGFDVRVAVVEAVDVLVEGGDVDEPVGEVEVELPVEGDQEAAEDKQGRVGLGGERCLV